MTKVTPTPWDSRSLRVKTYELNEVSKTTLQNIAGNSNPGHYTAKIDPLDIGSRELLNHYGFYYCDTLIQPYCNAESIIYFEHPSACVTIASSLGPLLDICHGAFSHGRFHRDFNISQDNAHLRYDLWLEDLFNSGHVWNLNYEDKVIGFWGSSNDKILLHAINRDFRGKGISKFLWSAACREMFRAGHQEIKSSISAANIPALNLYISLGFRMREVKDVYHMFRSSKHSPF